MILHRIARDSNISASHEEVDEALNTAVQSMIMKGGADKASLDLEGLRESITNRIINERVFEFLEKTCSV
jgi:hypothetical protein